jgi:chemotaxis protein CheC
MTLDSFEHDLLLEVASVAAGKAIRPINSVTGQTVSIASVQLTLESMEKIADTMGSPEGLKTVVLVRITGDAHGAIVLMINPNDIDGLLPNTDDKLRISALEEIANIISGASLGGLSRLLNMKFIQSAPLQTTDMLRAVINEIVTDIGINNSQILCFTINFKVGLKPTLLSLYLLFDHETSLAIVDSGKKQIEDKHGSTN